MPISFLKSFKYLALSAVMTLPFMQSASAAIVSAVGATIDSGGPGFGNIADTYNQNGLSSNYVSGVTDFNTYIGGGPTHTPIFSGFEWFSNSGSTSAQVTYDLGSVLKISKMAIWNEEASGIGLLDLFGSTDGVTFTSLLAGVLLTDNPGGFFSYTADILNFTATNFRYIRLDMSGCPQPNGSFPACAIGEVAFNSVSSVPVPAALPLVMTGLFGLGALSRRRKQKSAVSV